MSKDNVSRRVGLMHKDGTTGAGTVVESFIYRGDPWTIKDLGSLLSRPSKNLVITLNPPLPHLPLTS